MQAARRPPRDSASPATLRVGAAMLGLSAALSVAAGIALFGSAFGLIGCVEARRAPAGATVVAVPAAPGLALRYLGDAALVREPQGALAHFGGISGLDHDAATGVWYLLSDDRSARAPARFYTAGIELDASGIRSVRVTGEVPLRRPDGSTFPGLQGGGEAPDPEALRIDPVDGELVWASEGNHRQGAGPFVRRAARDGRFVAEVPLPANLRVHEQGGSGVRDNLAIEGLAFAPDGASLWVAMEAPLAQDGPLPSSVQGGFARFTRLGRQGQVLGQYAYPLSPVPLPPAAGLHRADNGVAEILATGPATLLVVERSGREVEAGTFQFTIRIYEASAQDATDVSRIESLQDADFVVMRKRLVLDLSTAGIGDTDNIEAAAWGPRLPNGHATLLLASDDNFHPRQANRLLAFEVQGR